MLGSCKLTSITPALSCGARAHACRVHTRVDAWLGLGPNMHAARPGAGGPVTRPPRCTPALPLKLLEQRREPPHHLGMLGVHILRLRRVSVHVVELAWRSGDVLGIGAVAGTGKQQLPRTLPDRKQTRRGMMHDRPQ